MGKEDSMSIEQTPAWAVEKAGEYYLRLSGCRWFIYMGDCLETVYLDTHLEAEFQREKGNEDA